MRLLWMMLKPLGRVVVMLDAVTKFPRAQPARCCKRDASVSPVNLDAVASDIVLSLHATYVRTARRSNQENDTC